MEPQTFLFIIGNVLFIIGVLLADVQSWFDLIKISVWELIWLVIYAVGINCMVTGACENYAWAIAVMLAVVGAIQFLQGLYAVATVKRQERGERQQK